MLPYLSAYTLILLLILPQFKNKFKLIYILLPAMSYLPSKLSSSSLPLVAAEMCQTCEGAQQLKPGVRATDLYPTLQSIDVLTSLMGSSCLAIGGQNTQSCVCCRVPMITYCIPILLSKTSEITRFCAGAVFH